MKTAPFMFALALAGLTACSTTTTPLTYHRSKHSTWDTPETVVVTYHVQPGQEVLFPLLLARAWKIYRHEHLVRSEPHVIVREREDDGKMRYEEIFTWVSHSAPDHAPPDVRAVWNQEMSSCEGRNGHPALEGGEVELVLP